MSLINRLLVDYRDNSDVCIAEYLASETVPGGVTFEEAFEAYIECMKQVEGDRFIQVRENEILEL